MNRKHEYSAFLWIDYGDSERNARIFYELQDRIGDAPLPFELSGSKENACSPSTPKRFLSVVGSTKDEQVKALPNSWQELTL